MSFTPYSRIATGTKPASSEVRTVCIIGIPTDEPGQTDVFRRVFQNACLRFSRLLIQMIQRDD